MLAKAKMAKAKIHVRRAESVSGPVWIVTEGAAHATNEKEHAIYSGELAKDHALKSALRLAEVLREKGPVIVLVDAEPTIVHAVPAKSFADQSTKRAS